MKNYRAMTDAQIYQDMLKESEGTVPAQRADYILKLFHESALFLVARIENDGWKKWRVNYLREHTGCALGEMATNTVSPHINELFFRRYPVFRNYESSQLKSPQLFD